MKKIFVCIALSLGSIFLIHSASAQFTSTTCEGQAHCSAPTTGVHYQSNIMYIGKQGEEFDLGFQLNFDKQKILLQEVFLVENKNFVEDDIRSRLRANLDGIQSSKAIIINTSKFDILLQVLGELHTSDDLNLQDKTIYLVTDSNKFFLKRVLAKNIKPIEITKIYTLSEDKLLNFLSTFSLGKINNTEAYITPFSLSFHETPKYLPISYLVDRLIYHGFPVELITMFLILSLGTLVISILRQVVGFSVFGIYSPLLFAVSMSLLGIPLSLMFLGIGLLTKILIMLFTKKVYLLHNAKSALLIILYFFILLSVLGFHAIFGFNRIDISLLTNGYIIFPIVFIILVSDKIFNEGFKLFSIGRWFAFAEFLAVSFAVYGLFFWTALTHLLLAFPEILLLIFLINIAVGRFTGLQLLEYFRFMPLIKKSSDSEEEE